MMLPLYHVNDIWPVSCYLLRPISGIKALDVLKVVAHSSEWRNSSFSYVAYLHYILLILGGMADSEGSATSSLDPMVELDAEVRVSRRRVRRHGHFLQQLDEMGGRRLDQIDEDIGRTRSDLKAALRILDEKVTTSMDKLDFRMQRIEGIVAMLRDGENSSRPPSQITAKSPSGALAKQH